MKQRILSLLALLTIAVSANAVSHAAEDVVTGIDSLTASLSKGEGANYNVSGQRLSKMQKGINITNGKKVSVK